jgi:intracellular septation protein A
MPLLAPPESAPEQPTSAPAAPDGAPTLTYKDGAATLREVLPPAYSKREVLAIVARRSGPALIEASVVPAVLFYSFLVAMGLGAAYVVAVVWSYTAMARRVVQRRPVPTILVIGVVGVTVRTLVAVASRSSFVYFFQPVLGTVAMGCVFLLSVGVGRPLIGRLAGDFWPISVEDATRPAVLRLFRHLTLLWAAVNLTTAAVTMSLLVSLPLGTFVAAKQVSGLAVTATAVFVTISLSVRTARREGLASVPSRRCVPVELLDR